MTAGAGHRRAAEAIAEAARVRHPQAVVDCVDLLAFVPAWLRSAYPGGYEAIVARAPWLWGASYYGIDALMAIPGLPALRRLCNRLTTRRFRRWLAETRPDVTITTHFFSGDVLADAWPIAPPVVVITDLFPHRLWLVRGAGAFAVGSDAVRDACVRRGIAAERLRVVGIPVSARFAQPIPREETLRGLGLDPARRTVLLSGGGMGLSPMEQVLRALLASPRLAELSPQFIAVCGNNRRAQQQLDALAASAPAPVKVLGFIDTMPALMQAADLMVTKAGGMTMVEALTCGLPQILTGIIPGQERMNARFVEEHGAGLIADDSRAAADAVLGLLQDPDRLSAMRSAARACAHPTSAIDIVDLFVTRRLSHET